MDILTFDDFDEYAAAIQSVNVQMMLNRLVHPSWTFQHFEVEGIHFQTGCQGSGDLTIGESPSEGYIFYLPLHNSAAQHANGQMLSAGSVLVFEPGCEFYMNSEIDHSWCTVFVPNSKIINEPTHSQASSKQCRIATVSPQIAKSFYALVDRLFSAVNAFGELARSQALEAPLWEICRLSSLLIGSESESTEAKGGRPRIDRKELVHRILSVLEQSEDNPVSVKEIAALCEVSERTLRSAFKEFFGISPTRFLQLRTLHQVRRTLRKLDPDSTTVSEILVRNGVWEFGRFSRRYCDVFGELPSQTLRSKN